MHIHTSKIWMPIVALTTIYPLTGLASSGGAREEQDAAARAATVLAEARTAIGGEDRLRAVKTLQASGDMRRSMGPMQMDGALEILIETPDKLRRNEEINVPNGATAVRTEVLNGAEAWDDSSTRGGMGGGHGMAIVMRGPGGAEMDPERMKEMQRRMRRMDLARFTLAWLLTTDAPVMYAGVAEAPDGKADVLEIKPADGPALRLFIDQQTHMPLMLTWRGPQPRMVVRRGPGGPGAPAAPGGPGAAVHPGGPPPPASPPAESGPASDVTMEMRFSDYKKVDGIQLPHLIARGMNGETNEEWTIKAYKVNPSFKANTFTK